MVLLRTLNRANINVTFVEGQSVFSYGEAVELFAARTYTPVIAVPFASGVLKQSLKNCTNEGNIHMQTVCAGISGRHSVNPNMKLKYAVARTLEH